MSNFWHMQLHPGDANWDIEELNNILLNCSVIGMGEEWDNDRGAPSRFKNNVQKGDLVIIRHQGAPRFRVKIVGDCISNSDSNAIDAWFEIYRKVEILSNEGVFYKEKYRNETRKNWSNGIYPSVTFETANNWDFAKYWYNEIINKENMNNYITLIENNSNLILTGAPGTGKTYLAKQIAAQMILGKEYDEKNASEEEKSKMEEQYDFVQFHPSFDYTDFVEGLRPIDDGKGNVSFHREDGIFMRFCRKALDAYHKVDQKENAPKFVFIIDEINRGELSKIFGELFFSIDPGYRGEKGKVKTQYYNLWKNDKDEKLRNYGGSEFFYIPNNVYIIGTMNDIDRSVESMDFAIRRRFAFKEILASERMHMIKSNPKLSCFYDDIAKRMINLNLCILTIQEFTTAYQIGAAYFLKLGNYLEKDTLTDMSWENLWGNHLQGLLFEYLRGLPNAEEDLVKLRRAYDMEDIYKEKDGKVIKVEGNNE